MSQTQPRGHERIETHNLLMIVLVLITLAIGQPLVSASAASGGSIKISNAPDDLLRESAFCLIPAAAW